MEATGIGTGYPGVQGSCTPGYQWHTAGYCTPDSGSPTPNSGYRMPDSGYCMLDSGQPASPGDADGVPDTAAPKMQGFRPAMWRQFDSKANPSDAAC